VIEARGARAVKQPAYARGDRVRVLRVDAPGHIRTPWYVRGLEGEIERFVGYFRNPEELAYGRYNCEKRALYRVRFPQILIWPDYTGPRQDTLDVEIYEHWLEPVKGKATADERR
jgi:nitrile hydratase